MNRKTVIAIGILFVATAAGIAFAVAHPGHSSSESSHSSGAIAAIIASMSAVMASRRRKRRCGAGKDERNG